MWWLSGCLLLAEAPTLASGGADATSGQVVAVGVGYDSACAAYERGIACTEDDLPAGDYAALDGGLWGFCGVATNGDLVCEGDPGERAPDTADAVEVGDFTACALRDGQIACWGDNDDDLADPPGGEDWDALSLGTYNGCATSRTGELGCWGDSSFGVTREPEGLFRSVATMAFNACAVDTDGRIQCWGSTDESPPRDGPYTEVVAGAYPYCALTETGNIHCWGDDDEQQSSPPEGEFEALDCGYGGCCARSSGGDAVCWGSLDGLAFVE